MAAPTKPIRVDRDVLDRIEAEQRPRESYNETLRRLLLNKRERRSEGRTESRQAS